MDQLTAKLHSEIGRVNKPSRSIFCILYFG
jgi:hypothetical protein